MNPQHNNIRAIRTQRGLSMQQLAEACNTTRAQIDRLERGERRLTVDWLLRLAPALGCTPPDLLPGAPPAPPVAASASARDLLPVRSAARGGTAQEMFLSDGPIDRVPRPYALQHVKDSYAIYVVGTSMVPMYRPGQLLFINPHRPPAPGQGVVVTQKSGVVLVKEFVRRNEERLSLREYQPAERVFALPLADIQDVHCVVGVAEI